MKRFRFRYQTLLEVRERHEKAQEEKFRQALALLAEAEAALQAIQAEFEAARAEQRASSEGALDLQSLLLFQEYLHSLERRIESQQAVVDEAKERVEARRGLLAEATQQAEIVRKLKQKAERTWLESIDAAEAAFLDELATVRYQRPNAQSGESEPSH